MVNHGGIANLASLINNDKMAASVKAEVAGALWSLSEATSCQAAIAKVGTVPPLVALLGNGHERAREHAAQAIASLARDNEPNQIQVTQLLIDLLTNGAEEAQERAARALWALVEDNPNAHDAIAQAGSPPKLVHLLVDGLPAAKDYALWSLSLAINADNQAEVLATGGVDPLIGQLSEARMINREQAASALAKLALDNEDTRQAITASGGVKPLLTLLDASEASGHTDAVLRQGADAIANLAVEPSARDEIASSGGLKPLVDLLRAAEGTSAKKFAARALARLSHQHEPTQLKVLEEDAIAPLVRILGGRQEEPLAQEEAAGALYALAELESNRRAITAADGIGELVNLLAVDNLRAQQHAEGALVRLSQDQSNRALIIKKLVQMLNVNVVGGEAEGGGIKKRRGSTPDALKLERRNSIGRLKDEEAEEVVEQTREGRGEEQAAAALANLARESEENRNSIVNSNGIPPLLALIDSPNAKVGVLRPKEKREERRGEGMGSLPPATPQ